MKITDYHRELAAKYYGLLLKRFRFETLLRHTGRKRISLVKAHQQLICFSFQ